MKGVFNLRPPVPRYQDIWDPQVVLKKLRTWSPAKKISLKMLTLKVVMLLLLVSGYRAQISTKLNVENMTIDEKYYYFQISNADLKQGRPGYKPEMLKLKVFNEDKK